MAIRGLSPGTRTRSVLQLLILLLAVADGWMPAAPPPGAPGLLPAGGATGGTALAATSPQLEKDLRELLAIDEKLADLKRQLEEKQITQAEYGRQMRDLGTAQGNVFRRHDGDGQRELHRLYGDAKRNAAYAAQEAQQKAMQEKRQQAAQEAQAKAEETRQQAAREAQARDEKAAPYLTQIPDAARVLQEITGRNDMDTAARQQAALAVLHQAMVELSGKTDARQVTPTEAARRRGYQEAYDRIGKEIAQKLSFDPKCQGAQCPHAVHAGLLAQYRRDKAFEQEVLNRLWPPQFVAQYRATQQRNVEAAAARAAAEKEARARHEAAVAKKNRDDAIVTTLFVLGLGGGLVALVWLIVWWKRRSKRLRIMAIAEYIRPDFEAWDKLGATREERAANIEKMFEAKRAIVKFGTRWDYEDTWHDAEGKGHPMRCYAQFRISRSLAVMEPREREFLRLAYVLHNAGKISEKQWRYFSFALINGNGKATIENWDLNAPDKSETGMKNGPSIVKFFQESNDGSVDSAVNALMAAVEKSGDGDEVVKAAKDRLHGGGAWLAPGEIPGTIFSADGPYALRLGKVDGSDTDLTYAGEGSLITIAPPGSGKTQCFVLPNLLVWPGPAVVLDVKGEIYAATSKWRSENVGPVFRFSPLDPDHSHCYNPLVFVRSNPDFIWEDARFLADMMIVPSGGSDPFWENMARDVLTAAIAYVCYSNGPKDRPMSKLMDLLYGMEWDAMVASLKTNLEVPAMRQTGHGLSEMEKKTRDSVLKTAQSSMSAWQGARVAKSTSRSDWSPLDLRTGKPTIYICINPNEIDSYLSVLRVFIAQHIRMLTSALPPRDAAPVLFVLDELPRLRKMPPVDEALNIGRQYGIRLWMFTQSYGQLKEAYPNAEGMLGSCTVRTFMNVPLNDELAQKLSDQLGFRDGPLDASRVKLVEPLELAGPSYRDVALVLATNTKPVKLRKAFAWKDPELQARMGSL